MACLLVTLLVPAPAGAAAGWHAPVNLSRVGQSASLPQVAVDAQGTAVAVWQRFNGTHTIVQSAVRPAGGAWQAPRDLSAPGQEAFEPQVAVDAHGTAVAIWERFNGTHFIVQATVRSRRGAWQAPVDLSAPGGDATQPHVALDAQGTAVAIWRRFNGSDFIVQGSVRPADGAWQAPTDLSGGGNSAYHPQLAVDAQGTAVAVWERSNATNAIVQATVRARGGAWQAPVDLSAPGQHAVEAQVTIDAQGTALAVWRRFNGFHWIVQATVRAAGGTWQAPVDLTAVGQDAIEPQVAADAQGNALAVWRRLNDGAYWTVQSMTRSTDGSWQAPSDLTPPRQDHPRKPQVAVDAHGNAFAVWLNWSFPAYHDTVQGTVRPADGPWQAPTDLSRPGQDYVTEPELAAGPQGTAIAIWARSDGAHLIVQAADYGPTPPPLAVVANLRLSPSTFRAARSDLSVDAAAPVQRGTRVSYTLNVGATVRFTVEHKRRGRFERAPGSFARSRPAGDDHFTFTGRIAGRALQPGEYRLVATPTAGDRNGTPARAPFRIVR